MRSKYMFTRARTHTHRDTHTRAHTRARAHAHAPTHTRTRAARAAHKHAQGLSKDRILAKMAELSLPVRSSVRLRCSNSYFLSLKM